MYLAGPTAVTPLGIVNLLGPPRPATRMKQFWNVAQPNQFGTCELCAEAVDG